jgi:hypothetical protein
MKHFHGHALRDYLNGSSGYPVCLPAITSPLDSHSRTDLCEARNRSRPITCRSNVALLRSRATPVENKPEKDRDCGAAHQL